MGTTIPPADGTHRLGEQQPDDLVPEAEPGDDYEIIKHPAHYNSHPAGIECITVIEPMTLNVGTAIKHLWRAGLKPNMDEIDDLEKAITYIQFEIARLKRPIVAPREPGERDLTVSGTIVGITSTGTVTADVSPVRFS